MFRRLPLLQKTTFTGREGNVAPPAAGGRVHMVVGVGPVARHADCVSESLARLKRSAGIYYRLASMSVKLDD
ncbi:MAG: hypothetical protein AB7S38_21145 [Vulcanimicrobiota bacterium]